MVVRISVDVRGEVRVAVVTYIGSGPYYRGNHCEGCGTCLGTACSIGILKLLVRVRMRTEGEEVQVVSSPNLGCVSFWGVGVAGEKGGRRSEPSDPKRGWSVWGWWRLTPHFPQ